MQRMTVNSHFSEQDKKLLEEMKKSFYASPRARKYIHDIGISDELAEKEIIKINDFVQDLAYCKHCPGIKKCQKETPCLVSKIVYSNGYVDRQQVPCKKYLEFIAFKRQFLIKDFPEDWLNSVIKNLDISSEREEIIKRYNAFLKNESKNWIYIFGEIGTGRSFVAANIAVDIAKKGLGPIAFIDAPTRFKELAGKRDQEYNSLLEKYQTVPVLIIDDLGNEYKSDFVRESVLFPIINARNKNNLFTIITSDFSISDIATMYITNQASKPKVEQIKRMLKNKCGEEINLGSVSVYR